MYLPVRCPEMTGDDRPGRFREMHDMGFAILGTMGCNAPRSGFRVDLNWARLHNFLTALTSERQEFDDPAVRPRHLARRNNDCGELVVGQNTISADLPWSVERPSAGDASITARPTHQRKNVFSILSSR